MSRMTERYVDGGSNIPVRSYGQKIDIDSIIETTAASDDDHGLKLDPPSTTSKVREKAVAHLLYRFLQNCPEELTVMELRELVENSPLSFR